MSGEQANAGPGDPEHSLSLLRSTLESTAEGVLVVDLDGRWVVWNQRFLDMWRMPADVAERRDDAAALAYVLPQLVDPEGFMAAVSASYAEPEAVSFGRDDLRDGRVFERYSIPQRLGDRIVGRVWSLRDITERARAERRLRTLVEEQAALRRVAMAVAREAPEDELFTLVADQVRRLLQAKAAALLRFEPDGPAVAVAVSGAGVTEPADVSEALAEVRSSAHPAIAGDGQAVLAPVCLLGECWGAVQALRDPSEPFGPEDEARLARFADLVAQAVANAEARAALAASRQRIVEAADAERRRLERNLHDGAQQRLVSVALLLRVAENRVNDGGEGAAALVRSAAEECALALEELRELARGIHPAVLSEHGLAPALAGLAGRCPVPVRLDVELDERLPGGVEASAYYVVSEALANVTKYAGASEVIVRASFDDAQLVVEVEDDGVGGADSGRGTGLRGLADRVDALAGRLIVESEPGCGTLVRAELPVRGR